VHAWQVDQNLPASEFSCQVLEMGCRYWRAEHGIFARAVILFMSAQDLSAQDLGRLKNPCGRMPHNEEASLPLCNLGLIFAIEELSGG
jgi:hypothetical protein